MSQSVNQKSLIVLEAVILEQQALAHFINAEAEKNSAAAVIMARGGLEGTQLLAFQNSVNESMRKAVNMQVMLQVKLERLLSMVSLLSQAQPNLWDARPSSPPHVRARSRPRVKVDRKTNTRQRQ